MNIEFFVYDEITPAMARDLGERLRASPSAPVTIRVNSYGGDLGAGLAMLLESAPLNHAALSRRSA